MLACVTKKQRRIVPRLVSLLLGVDSAGSGSRSLGARGARAKSGAAAERPLRPRATMKTAPGRRIVDVRLQICRDA
jgi:hypothetical protein